MFTFWAWDVDAWLAMSNVRGNNRGFEHLSTHWIYQKQQRTWNPRVVWWYDMIYSCLFVCGIHVLQGYRWISGDASAFHIFHQSFHPFNPWLAIKPLSHSSYIFELEPRAMNPRSHSCVHPLPQMPDLSSSWPGCQRFITAQHVYSGWDRQGSAHADVGDGWQGKKGCSASLMHWLMTTFWLLDTFGTFPYISWDCLHKEAEDWFLCHI